MKYTKYYYIWKIQSIHQDYIEQINLLENDVIIEKSKSIVDVVFTKLNVKLETIKKIRFLFKIKSFTTKINYKR